MNHAFSSAETDQLRTRPHGSKWYLAHHVPRPLADMTLAATPQTHPVSAIEYTGSSGGLVDKDVELWIGSANGSQLGKLRLRGTPTTNGLGASILPVAEAGSGLINWGVATTISAKERYYPYPRHPRYDTSGSQWRMDYSRAWPGSVIGPYANMGAPVVGFLENGSFTASFFNTNHLFWDAASLSVIWEFPNSSAVHNSGSSFAVTFTGASPSGSYIKCTVTDESGASESAYRLIFVFDDEAQLPHVNVGEIQGGLDSKGYRVSVEILDDGHEIQNDAEIVVFSKNVYGTSTSQFGGNSPGRGNVLFHGFVLRDSIQRKPFVSTATLEAVTIDGVLRETNSYDTFFARKSSPTEDWIHEPILNLDRVAMRLLKERSTVSRMADFYPMSGIGITNGLILFQDLPKTSLWEQLTQNYGPKGVLGIVASDMQGAVRAFQDGQICGESVGSAIQPMVISLRDEDMMDQIDYQYEERPRNAYVRLEAVASDTPIGAESPGDVQGYFGGEQQITKGLTVQSQDQLITWAGNMRAKLNNTIPNISAKLAGNYVIDAIPQHTVKVSMASSQNPLGRSLSEALCYQKNLRLEYKASDQFMLATIDMEQSVNGIGGSAITFPKVTDMIPIPTPSPAAPSDPPGETQGGGFGTVYALTDDTLGRTRAFSATAPSWTDISPTDANSFNDWILDSWHPSTAGYLISDSGVWKSSTLDLVSPSFSLVLTAAQIATALSASSVEKIYYTFTSINVENYVAVFFGATVSGTFGLYCARSSDGGASWNYSLISAVTTDTQWTGAVDYVPYLVNGAIRIYVASAVRTNRNNPVVYRSDDSGATWALVASWGSLAGQFPVTRSIHCPYDENSNGSIAYLALSATSGGNGLYVSTDSGVGWTKLYGDSATKSAGVRRRAVETYTQDKLLGFWWCYISGVQTLYVTDDEFASVSTAALTGLTGTVGGGGGFPYNDSQFYVVTTAGIYVSIDGGENWIDKTGDWAWAFTGAKIIVPDWTE